MVGNNTTTLSFHGGTGEVTGANFFLDTNRGRILIDCGMVQGTKQCEEKNWVDFPYDPSSIDYVFITHAHQDHIGRLPKLVRDGFNGTIYSTEPTMELAEIMLEDSMHIMEEDAEEEGRDPLFSKEDLDKTLSLWKGVPYHNVTDMFGDSEWTFELKDAGHVLGSAMIKIYHEEKSILFTGDLGNSPNVILHSIEEINDVDYVVMESVYGNRNHEDTDERTKLLERAIEDVVQNNATLLIPIFSLERTQEILFEINNFVENSRVPELPMYLDSPLAIRATEIYRHSTEFFNKHTRSLINEGSDVFNFSGLSYTNDVEESKAINVEKPPKVIMAGSGMMNGGRVLHHAIRYLPDPKAIVLFVGYQAAGTLGRVIQEGARTVTIFGNEIPVRADIRTINGYSGHAGMDELLEFTDSFKDQVTELFCTMGEPASSMFLAQRLRDYKGIRATVPKAGEKKTLYL